MSGFRKRDLLWKNWRPRAQEWVGFALAGITLITYWNVVYCDFVNYDDPYHVTDNPYVREGLTFQTATWAFRNTYLSWHPLTWLSLMCDAHLFGTRPGLFHLSNLWLHIINTVLLFWFLSSTTGRIGLSGAAAALFGWHPIHVESVAWISERKGVLNATFFWGMLVLYVRYARRPTLLAYLGVITCFVLSLMAKAMTVSAPILLLFLDVWPCRRLLSIPKTAENKPQSLAFRRPLSAKMSFSWLFLEKVPLIILSAAFSLLTYHTQEMAGATDNPVSNLPLVDRLANAAMAYCRYVSMTFWPRHFAVFYPYPSSWGWVPITAAAVFLAFVTGILVWKIKKAPYLAVGWLWFLGAFLPVIGIVQVGLQFVANRYSYLPLVGLFVSFVWGIDALFRRFKSYSLLSTGCAAVILMVCILQSRIELGFWRNSATLFGRAITVTRNNWVAHRNLGSFLAEAGFFEAAIDHFQQAIRIFPLNSEFHYDLARAWIAVGKKEQAIAALRQGLEIEPSPETRAMMTAEGCLVSGDIQKSLSIWRVILSLNPNHKHALAQMSWILSTWKDEKMRDGPGALALARRLCELTGYRNPYHLKTLAAAQTESRQVIEAIQTLRAALNLVQPKLQPTLQKDLRSMLRELEASRFAN